ncbi:MAG: quinol:cytochrome C oxidoreductase [Flavobacteriales bacterium]|jgi:hypothetical protein|nr:quinol:cytochrome C oxidoreductase [Flavobacteriales bacterium]
MEYQISDKAKKVTLGLAIVGLVLMIIGFFSQKEYVFAEKIDEHSVNIEYWGNAEQAKIDALKTDLVATMEAKGYQLDIHDAGHGHADHHGESHDAHADHDGHGEHAEHGDEHEAHGSHHASPTFLWSVHIKHAEGHEAHGGHHEDAAQTIVELCESGTIAFSDSKFRRFWSNLLINGFFFFGIALGALFYLALHYATESGWGVVLLRVFEGVSQALPIGIIVLVIVFATGAMGLHDIYSWMDPENVKADHLIWRKSGYFNQIFFWIRVVAYFGIFIYFMKWFRKMSMREDEEGGTVLHFTMFRRAALFLVFFAVFSSTMSWDFIMSIDIHWYSTLFGWYTFSGIWLSGIIMVLMITGYLKSLGYLEFVKQSHIHDLAKWMFALSFLWSYLWFSQFMLIWYSNIGEETIYYWERIMEYKYLYFTMFGLNFVLPMVFLMARDVKRSWGFIVVIGSIIFVGHWFDVFMMVMPGTLHDEWSFGLLDVGMFALFLGGFLFTVLKSMGNASLVQKNHPFLEESKHHEF